MHKIELLESVSGFTERDANSKAVLNTDRTSFLKHKIQKRKLSEMNKNSSDINNLRHDMDQLKTDLSEIKNILLQITGNVR